MSDFLESYLVKLGFTTDTTAFAQFSAALRDASALVDNEYLAMAQSVLKFQGAAIGVFAAIGGATLAMVDKVAMSDQSFRLMALRMYTTLPVARSLSIALDALGVSLEDVMWDPESAKRFHQLIEDQRILTKELGPDFENQMLKIRDFRFEFSRFGVELQYLTMQVVKDLAQSFGFDLDTMFGKVKNFNDWAIQNMPQIAQWITDHLRPILIDTKDVAIATGQAIEGAAVAFTSFVGLLSGNKDLQSAAFSFDRFSQAIETSLGWLKDSVVWISKEEVALSHFITALSDLATGDFKGAAAELKAGAQEEARSSPTAAPNVVRRNIQQFLGYQTPGSDTLAVQRLIIQMATQYKVPPELAIAVAQQESSLQQFDKQGHVLMNRGLHGESHAMGIFQLQPSTAAEMGVDATDPVQNALGGVMYLQKLLKQYGGNQEVALEHYYGSKDVDANRKYAASVLEKESKVNIESVTINVNTNTNANPKEIGDAVWQSLRQAIRDKGANETQRNIQELAAPNWSY